jgi:hypothetical protein
MCNKLNNDGEKQMSFNEVLFINRLYISDDKRIGLKRLSCCWVVRGLHSLNAHFLVDLFYHISIKLSLQHFQFCRVGLSLGILIFSSLLVRPFNTIPKDLSWVLSIFFKKMKQVDHVHCISFFYHDIGIIGRLI